MKNSVYQFDFFRFYSALFLLGKKYVISKIEDLWDDQSTGPITADSVINIKYSTVEDTEAEEPFDVTINYHTSKYMVFGYVPMPQAVHDLAGKALAELPNIKYLGNRYTLIVWGILLLNEPCFACYRDFC